MEAVLALGTKKKVKNLSRRINRKVTSVQNADDLIERLDREEPVLIIVDIALPSLSGKHLVERLRKKGLDVPLLFVTDLAAFDVTKLVAALGSIEVAKPKSQREKRQRARLQPDLHDSKSGRIDAGKVAAFYGLSLSKLAKILRRSPQSVHKTPDAAGLQNKLGIFLRIATALVELFGSADKARFWLNTPHPELDNTRPMELIERRKGEIVADLLEDALLGHPG